MLAEEFRARRRSSAGWISLAGRGSALISRTAKSLWTIPNALVFNARHFSYTHQTFGFERIPEQRKLTDADRPLSSTRAQTIRPEPRKR